MPQRSDAVLPFTTRANPDVPRARARHLAWVRAHGLLADEAQLRRYGSWRLTDLVGYAYPGARGDDLDLATDSVCLGFPLDDAFDGPLGRHPERAVPLIAELCAIPRRAPGARPRLDLPLTRAYADVWQRTAVGMSAAWRERAARHLGRFFRSYLAEARNRSSGEALTEAAYVRLRRESVGTGPCFDLIERTGHFEVPPAAHASGELRTLTRCAGDVIFLGNDLHSLAREESRGDPHNLVLIREHATGCTRAEATAYVTAEIRKRVRLFTTVSRRLPRLCARLGLGPADRAAVEAYAAGLRAWMAANELWGTTSPRYGTPGVSPDAAAPAAAPRAAARAT